MTWNDNKNHNNKNERRFNDIALEQIYDAVFLTLMTKKQQNIYIILPKSLN